MSNFNTIIITGTPGTGKTTLAKKLSLSLHYTYFDVGNYIKNAKIYENYDKVRDTRVVDPSLLVQKLLKVRDKELKKGSKGVIFDSHMSHFLPKEAVNLCILTKCSLPILSQRLTSRHYAKSKVRENLEAEIFQICLSEAKEFGHKILQVNTSDFDEKKLNSLIKRVKTKLSN